MKSRNAEFFQVQPVKVMFDQKLSQSLLRCSLTKLQLQLSAACWLHTTVHAASVSVIRSH